jgi:hypothetical protein
LPFIQQADLLKSLIDQLIELPRHFFVLGKDAVESR